MSSFANRFYRLNDDCIYGRDSRPIRHFYKFDARRKISQPTREKTNVDQSSAESSTGELFRYDA